MSPHLPEHVAPVVRVLYLTRMRRGEALGLEWSRVDFEAGAIKLRPSDTKTRHARTVALGGLLRAVLRLQRDRVAGMERERQSVIREVLPDCSEWTFKRWWARR